MKDVAFTNVVSKKADAKIKIVFMGGRILRRQQMGMTETIKAEYNGYTGYAYGVSSFSIRDKNDKEIFHTAFLRNRPTNKAECLQTLKEMLDLIKTLRER